MTLCLQGLYNVLEPKAHLFQFLNRCRHFALFHFIGIANDNL